MNWYRILKFSVVLFVFPVLLSTLITYFIGMPGSENYSIKMPLFVDYGLITVFSISVFATLAKRQLVNPFAHVLCVGLIVEFVGFFIVWMLMGEVYIFLTWVLDLPSFAIAIALGTIIGIKLQKQTPKNTTSR